MKCPFCDKLEDKVIDSRTAREGEVIRRRRECLGCKRRFTTYERIEENLPMVVKKDNRREPFDRAKILAGLKKACEKRPVSIGALGAAVDRIEKRIQDLGETRCPAEQLVKKSCGPCKNLILWHMSGLPRCTVNLRILTNSWIRSVP